MGSQRPLYLPPREPAVQEGGEAPAYSRGLEAGGPKQTHKQELNSSTAWGFRAQRTMVLRAAERSGAGCMASGKAAGKRRPSRVGKTCMAGRTGWKLEQG